MTNTAVVVNCWPSPRGDGKCDVVIDYELEAEDMVLQDVKISIPLPYVPSTSCTTLADFPVVTETSRK